MNKLFFGAAYYDEYTQTDRLEKDLALMRKAGINTIRIAESTWSVEEPRCGEFDFSHVTRVIEAAGRAGIGVIVGTPTYAIPKWLYDLEPAILGENPFGPRQNMDITHPTYRFYAERIIRELVSRTAGYPNVIGFQIDNETKHYGVNNQRVREGFRAWMKRRFGTIEAVNKAFLLNHWSNSVASFEELPDPASTVHGGYACAFEAYRRELAAEFLRWQAGIVGEYKRLDQFVTHNLDYAWQFFGAAGQQDGCSAGLQPDISHFEAAKALTLTGTDIYCPPGDNLTGWEIAFGGDVMRPLKRSPYLVLESQSQAFTGWLPYPGQLRLMALLHIASGARGLMYWPWASLHSGIEAYWKGILSHDGEPGETYREVVQIGQDLQQLAPLLSEQLPHPRIAVIVSPESLHAMRRFPTDKYVSYNDVLRLFHQALFELNLSCDVLYDREEDWNGYDLLIFPEYYAASDAMIGRVRAFVEQGGTVLASFRSFFADENLLIRQDRQPHGLYDVFGMHYDRFTKLEGCPWAELLETDTAEIVTRYAHPVWKRYASLTRNVFGRGRAWYLGALTDWESIRDCLLRVCEDAGIPVPEQRWPIIVRKRLTEDGRTLRFVLNCSAAQQRIPGLPGEPILLAGSRAEADGSLILDSWGVGCIRE